MKTSKKERVLLYINHLGISKRGFAIKCSIPISTFNNVFNRDSEFSLDVIEKIINSNESLNPDWLLRGEGSMLRTVEKKLNIDGTVNGFTEVERLKQELQFAQNQLVQLESTIGDKREIIALLKDKLAKKERDIKELTEQCAHLLNQLTSNNI